MNLHDWKVFRKCGCYLWELSERSNDQQAPDSIPNFPSDGFPGFCAEFSFYQFSVKTEIFHCFDCQTRLKTSPRKGCGHIPQ